MRGRQTYIQIRSRVAVAALLAVCCGCSDGPGLGEVRGQVTYGGQPVAQARVEFNPVSEGKQSVGYTDEKGQYEVQYTLNQSGALIGQHAVTVRVYPEPGEAVVPVPEAYAKSQVRFEVKPGNNRFDIELRSP